MAVEPFIVIGVAPGFAVTSNEMRRVFDARDAASLFDLLNTRSEEALASPRANNGYAVSLGDRCVLGRDPF